MIHLPDLLNETPFESPDRDTAKDRLSYAFVTGDSGGALNRFLSEAAVSHSDWEAESFAEDLFIDALIKDAMNVSLGKVRAPINHAFLKRVICSPPPDLASVAFRQRIHSELAEGATLRKEFVTLYRNSVQLREVLDTASVLGPGYFTQRRIDILASVKDAVDQIAASFATAESGLRRLREYGIEFQGTEGYRTLAEFLDYEGNLATVKLEVRMGADGRIRKFKIAAREESSTNRFYQSPIGRILTRIYLFLCGYEISNAGLVARWVETVFEGILDALSHLLSIIGHMEFYLAAYGFSQRCKAGGLCTCLPTFEEGSGHNLKGIFNPLLLAQQAPVIPCDIQTRSRHATVIITGPNSGGKTRLLQTIAMTQLLGQTGFVVPAERANIPFVSGMFASLMEHTRADQKEGRLGTELLRIRRLFERSYSGTLVVLDELCSGTNPSEGEEIFHLVICLLGELGCDAFISTHFLRFAKNLESENQDLNLEFLKVDWDDENRPTYQFRQGVATTSLAKHTAHRLGVSREDLLRLIERNAQKSRSS